MDLTQNKKFKVIILVGIQISLILGSFLVISQFTIQSELDLYTNTELLALKSEFIQSANLLTFELSNYSSMEKSELYLIQIALLFVNIGAHVSLLYLIYNILTKEKLLRSKSEKIQRRNQKLVNEFQDLLIQKNSSSIFCLIIRRITRNSKKDQ